MRALLNFLRWLLGLPPLPPQEPPGGPVEPPPGEPPTEPPVEPPEPPEPPRGRAWLLYDDLTPLGDSRGALLWRDDDG